MAGRFIISDPHFNHANIIKYESRPFLSVEVMNKCMIERWNSVVSDQDKVYVDGDFGFGSKEEMAKILSQLKGHKHLIMGNHDRHKRPSWWREVGFKEVYAHPIIIDKFVILSHEPVHIDGDYYVNIHGHVHSGSRRAGKDDKKHFNVSVEVLDYRPLNLDKLISSIR